MAILFSSDGEWKLALSERVFTSNDETAILFEVPDLTVKIKFLFDKGGEKFKSNVQVKEGDLVEIKLYQWDTDKSSSYVENPEPLALNYNDRKIKVFFRTQNYKMMNSEIQRRVFEVNVWISK